jgi:hypothetical protein
VSTGSLCTIRRVIGMLVENAGSSSILSSFGDRFRSLGRRLDLQAVLSLWRVASPELFDSMNRLIDVIGTGGERHCRMQYRAGHKRQRRSDSEKQTTEE